MDIKDYNKFSDKFSKIMAQINWTSFVTVLIGLILSLILADEFGVLSCTFSPFVVIGDILLLFIILAIARMAVLNHSLKVYIPLITIFSILTFFMLFIGIITGELYGFKSIFSILNLFVPIVIFIYLLFKGKDFIYMGISLIIINCSANFLKILPIGANLWGTALYYSVLGFIVVWLFAIPMIIIRFIQKDPAKNKHFANLFDFNIMRNDFIDSKFYILKYYDNKHNRSLIIAATYFFKLNNAINNIEFINSKDEFLSVKEEIQNLSREIQNALIQNKDPILNLDKFNKIKINSLNKIDLKLKENNINGELEDLSFFKELIKEYSFLFIYLSELFSDNPKYIPVQFNEIKLPLKDRIKNNFNLKNNTFRTAIRYLSCIGVIFILFLIFKGSLLTISLSTGLTIILFTIKDTVNDTFKRNMLRIVGSFSGMFIAVVLLIVLAMFDSLSFVIILTFLALLLYFAFKEKHFVLGLSCLMVFLLFINMDEFAFALLKRFLSVLIAVLVVSYFGSRILPNYRPSNIVSLIGSKFNLIRDLESNIGDLIKIDTLELTFKENNDDINYLLNEFKLKHDKNKSKGLEYEDEEFINHFKNLNDLINRYYNDLDTLVLCMKYNELNTENYCNIHSKIICSFSKIIMDNEMNPEIQLDELNEEFDKFSSLLTKDDFNSIKYINTIVVEDLELIKDLIFDMDSQNLFRRFNKNFMLRDYKKLF